MTPLQETLFSMQDLKYREFSAKLVPNIDKDRIIGIRTPALRTLAKELFATPEAADFLLSLPHEYLEENHLHAYLIALTKDWELLLSQIEAFLPYLDNWATCDTFSPKLFKKHPQEAYAKLSAWLKSPHPYTVRFAVVSLLAFYLDEAFQPDMLAQVAAAACEQYYVNMAIAWYYSVALVKQYDATIGYFETPVLPVWIHNKALQKALESFRIPSEQKAYLRTLKRPAQRTG